MMSRVLTIIVYIVCSLLILTSLSGLVWVNTQYAHNNPGEKDFLVPWLAARTFLQYGNSPYSDPATQRAQINYYGRLANADEDPLRLNVPFPLELFYFPFALIPDYALARGFWMTLLEGALVAFGVLSLQLTGWKPARTLLPVILVFSVLWIYGYLPLVASQPIIFVALAVTGLLLSIREQRDELAGALLVLPFFSPAILGVFFILLLWWTIYHRRWRILAGFLMTMIILFVLGFFLLPGWFMPFIRGLITHFAYNPGLTPGGLLGYWWPVVGPRLGWLLTIILLAILFFEWRNVRTGDFRHFLWTSCLTVSVTPFLGIPVIPQDEVVLFLPLILILTILGERWSHPRQWGIPGFAVPILLLSLWLVTVELFMHNTSSFSNNVLVLLLPIVLIIGLYWMRWWAVHPPRTWSDTIS
jgi:hypothetical protein